MLVLTPLVPLMSEDMLWVASRIWRATVECNNIKVIGLDLTIVDHTCTLNSSSGERQALGAVVSNFRYLFAKQYAARIVVFAKGLRLFFVTEERQHYLVKTDAGCDQTGGDPQLNEQSLFCYHAPFGLGLSKRILRIAFAMQKWGCRGIYNA